MLAALSSLRVTDGAKGFVANDVRDFSPYGLSPPSATVELTTTEDEGQAAGTGNRQARARSARSRLCAPGRPGRRGHGECRSAGRAAAIRRLRLRSQKVCDFEPVAVSEIRIKSPVRTFCSRKSQTDGSRRSRVRKRQTSSPSRHSSSTSTRFRRASFSIRDKVRDPELNPPLVTIQIRETRVGRTAATSADNELVLDLHIGRLDAARRSFYAQLDRDEAVLAIPDKIAGGAAQERDGVPRSIDCALRPRRPCGN